MDLVVPERVVELVSRVQHSDAAPTTGTNPAKSPATEQADLQGVECAAEHASPAQPSEVTTALIEQEQNRLAQTLATSQEPQTVSCATHETLAQGADVTAATPPASAEQAPPSSPPSEQTPTPQEAARRLERFTAKVQLKRPSPILKEPPKQRELTRKPPVPIQSRRTAAQQLDHVSASKRGEILLMRKLGVLPANAAPSSASRRSFDKLFTDLSNSDAEAFDELFTVNRGRGTRVARRPAATMV